MTPDERCGFYEQVLRTFWDNQEDLYWWNREDGTHFGVQCSDFFAWGTSDCEEILPEHLETLERTRQEMDSLGVDGQIWWPLVWAARNRGMRPQGAVYRNIPEALHPHFDAAGPVREVDLLNPRSR